MKVLSILYGIGMFCLTEVGELQIDCIPKKGLSIIGNACHLLNSHCKIGNGDAKNMSVMYSHHLCNLKIIVK